MKTLYIPVSYFKRFYLRLLGFSSVDLIFCFLTIQVRIEFTEDHRLE